MILSIELVNSVSSAIRNRGMAYYKSKRVQVKLQAPDILFTRVRGFNDYYVTLTHEDEEINCWCTCPYVDTNDAPCKHIWATILASVHTDFARTAQRPLELILNEDLAADTRRLAKAGATLTPPAPPKPAWETQIARLRTQIAVGTPQAALPVGPEFQLVYVVDLADSLRMKQLILESQIQTRKQNGDWGKPQCKHISEHQIESISNSLDQQLMMYLRAVQHHSTGYFYPGPAGSTGRYRLSGQLQDTVLQLLAQTDRVYLKATSPNQPLSKLESDIEKPWELSLTIQADHSGMNWTLWGQFVRGEESLDLTTPELVVPGFLVANGRFGRLKQSDAIAWVNGLRSLGSIAVPKAEVNSLLGELLRMPTLPNMTLPPELNYTEEVGIPKPRVVIKRIQYMPDQLEAKLSFIYGDVQIPREPFYRGLLLSESKRFLLRDADAEANAEQELIRQGCVWDNYQKRLVLKSKLLPKLTRHLLQLNWQIEAEGKLYRQPSEFHLSLTSGQDWFDLKATAHFEGVSVALPRLLEALNRGETSVLLDDGNLGMLPEEWLAKFGLFARMGTVEGESIRFGRAQVGVLDALLASRPEIRFDHAFGRARDQLKKFRGIAPADPPAKFKGTLREYQREGLGWLRFLRQFGFGGCLADDMGLGKTVQVLAFLAGIRKRNKPVLIVVPRSLIFHWKKEAERFAPHLKVLDHSIASRDKTGENFHDHDLILTTYGTLRIDAALFAEQHFDTCILDESQAAKNSGTETAKAVRLLQADHRLALSGTPVENHLGELWTLFDYLNPGMLGTSKVLAGAGPIRKPDPETRQILAEALRPFILRRTKDQVAKDLPEKTEKTVYCDLEPTQRALYDELRNHYRATILDRVAKVGMGRAKIQVLEALLRLRQAACHPGLIDKNRTREPSAKLDVLFPQLDEAIENGHKALVFSQFTTFLAIVRKRLELRKITYEYLDGKTRNRREKVDRFQSDPECPLFLISLKAGGVGLNLTSAEYVFLLDPWWNPAVEAQAIDRIHRIGQTKPVFAYRLIARDTVEEKVLALQESKRELADAIISGNGRLLADLKKEDLELLLS